MKLTITILLAALLCGCGNQQKQQWEYKTVKLQDQSQGMKADATKLWKAKTISDVEYQDRWAAAKYLTGKFDPGMGTEIYQLGYDGWELVSAVIEPRPDADMIMIFKKPK